ncbi:MAG TPA: hypothetical protein VF821_09825 [Lentzea sp.]
MRFHDDQLPLARARRAYPCKREQERIIDVLADLCRGSSADSFRGSPAGSIRGSPAGSIRGSRAGEIVS